MPFFNRMSLAQLIGALAAWPFEWARGLLQHQVCSRRLALARVAAPSPGGLADVDRDWFAGGASAVFDLARLHYAASVQVGMIERSLLASAAFERRLALLERLTLGPRARSV